MICLFEQGDSMKLDPTSVSMCVSRGKSEVSYSYNFLAEIIRVNFLLSNELR